MQKPIDIIVNLYSHMVPVVQTCIIYSEPQVPEPMATGLQEGMEEQAKRWLEELARVELPQSGPTTIYTRLLLDELKRNIVEWRNDTIGNYIEGLRTIFVGTRLLMFVVGKDFFEPTEFYEKAALR
jgi:hypothetical protein